MLLPEGWLHIQKQVAEQGLNRVVVRPQEPTHEMLFQQAIRQVGLNPISLELVNLGEQCSRVHRWRQSRLIAKPRTGAHRCRRVRVDKAVHKQLHPSSPPPGDRRRAWRA